MNHVLQGHQDEQVIVETKKKTWTTVEGNGKPLQYSCLENPTKSMKGKKTQLWKKDVSLRLVVVQ